MCNLSGGMPGIWVAPGSPYRSLEKTVSAIRYARENGLPRFGTCGGCQHMIIEYARNILEYRNAQHAEHDPYASNLFIFVARCSLAGREMMLAFVFRVPRWLRFMGHSRPGIVLLQFRCEPQSCAIVKTGADQCVGLDRRSGY